MQLIGVSGLENITEIDTQTLSHKHMDLQFVFSSGYRHHAQIDFPSGIGSLQQATADCPSMMDGMLSAGVPAGPVTQVEG